MICSLKERQIQSPSFLLKNAVNLQHLYLLKNLSAIKIKLNNSIIRTKIETIPELEQ